MKNIKDMQRHEVIYELAGKAHPTWFHSLLEWPTDNLKRLAAYYRVCDKDGLGLPCIPQLGITLAVGMFSLRLTDIKN